MATIQQGLVCGRFGLRENVSNSCSNSFSGLKFPAELVQSSVVFSNRCKSVPPKYRSVVVPQAVSKTAIDPKLQDTLKRAAAKKAASLVKPGNIVGFGTGSTASLAIEELGKLKLKDVFAVVTSFQARILCRQFGVKTVDLNDVNHIDIAIDGADEVDGSMSLIKGGGAAHTLEKVVDTMAARTVIIVDHSKVVRKLGVTFPVPVEVLPPAVSPVLRSLVALGGAPEIRSALRKDGPVMTDLGNMIVDVSFPNGIDDAGAMEKAINNIPGVVENGIFYAVTQTVLVATEEGSEISVVELADFVKTLPSLTAA